MSLEIIAGPGGAGKSYLAYTEIIEESIHNPERNFFIIVPEQFSMQTQKDLLELHPRHALFNIDVLSFQRLSYRVFSEVGGNRLPILDELGKSLILQKVATEHASELKTLGNTLKRQGSIRQLKSLISELEQYQVRPEDMDLWDLDGAGSMLREKTKDVRLLYGAFMEELQEKYVTSEEAPELLCRIIAKSAILKDSVVVLDGFTGFTPVQLKVLTHLMYLCGRISLVVTIDEGTDPFGAGAPHRLFYMSRQMIRKLTDIAREAGKEILPIRYVKPGEKSRFGSNAALRYLEQNLFRYRIQPLPEDAKKMSEHVVRLTAAETAEQEIRYAAGVIGRMVREEGYSYRDFAVVSGNLQTYGRYAEQILESEGIPFFIDEKRHLLTNSFVEFIRAAVDMVRQNLSYDSVFRYLRCGYSALTTSEINRMENYCLALGIRGRKGYEERWTRQYRGLKPEEVEELNVLRERFWDEIRDFYAGVRYAKSTVEEKTRALYELCVRLGVEEKLLAQAGLFALTGEKEKEREYSAIYAGVLDLMDHLVEFLGKDRGSLTIYQQLLDAGLSDLCMGLVPPGSDQVLVGDIERTRLKNVRVLFLVGVNEGVVPRQNPKTGIFSEPDRDILKENHIELAPDGREEMYRQRFYLYLNMTKPSDRLYLSWCKVDPQGKAMLPSYLVGLIKTLFPDLKEMDLETMEKTEERLETKEGLRSVLLDGLKNIHNHRPEEAWWQLFRWYHLSQEHRQEADRLIRAVAFENHTTAIGKAAAGALYGKTIVNSPTRLEKFAACAFSHFLNYGLKIKERQVYEFSAADMGSVLHTCLEKFAGLLKEEGRNWADLADQERDELAEQVLEETIHDYGNSILHSTSRNEYFITRAAKLLRSAVWGLQEQLKRGHFTAGGAEMSFYMKDGPEALHVSLDAEHQMNLTGRIDRMDLCEDENTVYVKIVDYKTGVTELDLGALYHGLQLQLMVYLNAAIEHEEKLHPDKSVEPAGVFYYHISDPFTKSEETIEQDRLKALKLNGYARSEKEVLERLDETLQPGLSSEIMQVGVKKNGDLKADSHVLSGDDFNLIRSFTGKKIREIGRKIMAGENEISPVVSEKQDACRYCPYKAVCGYDEHIPGYEKRRIRKMSTQEILQKMGEVD